jgi:NOL1/NOP2/fmu family ribosome biogenesis protein
MAKTQTRYFVVHKPEKYDDRFVQIGYSALGVAMGKLEKKGSKNLYLYLASNANNYSFELKVANYANWLGDPAYNEDGSSNETKMNTYSGHIKTGVAEMLKEGYLVEKFPGVYDFYEGGRNDNLSSSPQNVMEVINCQESEVLSECDDLSDKKQNMAEMTNYKKNDKLSEFDVLSDKKENITKSVGFYF